jgi:peroxiredoxin
MVGFSHTSVKWTINILILACFLIAFYRLVGIPFESTSPYLARGSSISLAGVNWSANHKTLVMAVRPGCPWCTASAQFYLDILHSNSAKTFHIVSISPDTVQNTRSYLQKLHLNIEDIRQVEFELLGIQGTPTLILVDRNGHIESTWIGKLSPRKEAEVFQALTVTRISSNDANPIHRTAKGSAL